MAMALAMAMAMAMAMALAMAMAMALAMAMAMALAMAMAMALAMAMAIRFYKNKIMKLYRMLKANYITQLFGQNLSPLYAQWGLKGHNGIDFLANDGEPIYWNCGDCEGKVIKTSEEVNEGIGVVVITEDRDGIFQHRFWHLKKTLCKVGDILSSGDVLGLADSTGQSTGTHLHYDLKPMKKDQYGNYEQLYPENGYNGAIDPMPYYNSVFILDLLKGLEQQISLAQKIIEKIKQLLLIK